MASLPVAQRSHLESRERHLRSLTTMSSRVDDRWGRKRNGVRDQKQATYSHVRANLKRAQLEDERVAAIELENNVLLAKLGKILRRSTNPTVGTRDWTSGMRLTQNQVPVIDHWLASDTTQFGAAVEPSTLNLAQRRQDRERIEVENRALVARLQSCRPTYNISKFEQDARERERWLHSHAKEPRTLSPLRPPRTAPQPPTSSRVWNNDGARPLSFPRSGSADGSPRKRNSPQKMQPLSGRNLGPQLDPSLVKVLDHLANHMKGATGSLNDMREARETLMEMGPIEPGVIFTTMRAGDDIEYEVVVAPNVADGCESLLILVHGGMFVTGSPRAVRHLAIRFSDEMRVPVAVPRLRLAPEQVAVWVLLVHTAVCARIGRRSFARWQLGRQFPIRHHPKCTTLGRY